MMLAWCGLLEYATDRVLACFGGGDTMNTQYILDWMPLVLPVAAIVFIVIIARKASKIDSK